MSMFRGLFHWGAHDPNCFDLARAERLIGGYKGTKGQDPDMFLVHMTVEAVGGVVTWPEEAKADMEENTTEASELREEAEEVVSTGHERAEGLRRQAEQTEARATAEAGNLRETAGTHEARSSVLTGLLGLVAVVHTEANDEPAEPEGGADEPGTAKEA